MRKESWRMLIAPVCVSVVAALKKEILQRSRNALSWLQILQLNNRSWKGRLADAEVAELKADRMEEQRQDRAKSVHEPFWLGCGQRTVPILNAIASTVLCK